MAISEYAFIRIDNISSGTLGISQQVSVMIADTPYEHNVKIKLVAKCGSNSVTVLEKTSTQGYFSANFTPPITWASNNTTGTSVSVVFTLSGTDLANNLSTNTVTKTVTMAIPSSVKPSTSMTLSDTTGYLSKYGSYIRYKSKVKVQLTNTLSYNSPISSYNIKANGVTYTTNPVTTDVLKTAGTNTIKAYVTDKRGRSSNTVSKNITVLDYANPSVSFSVRRCNEDGTLNENGGYCKVTYSVSISSLSNKNSKTLKLSYKVSSESTTTDVTLPMTSYSVTNQNYIFQASDDKSYNVSLSATDDFITTTKSTVLSTAFTLMHFNESGKGLAIGKLSEGDNFDVGIPSKFEQGINGLINCNGVDGITNIVDEVSKDTVDTWKTLGNNVYFFNKTGCLIDQPSQWGFLQNFTTGGVEVHQVWYTQATGSIWHRGGNASGWNGTWRTVDYADLFPITEITSNVNLNTINYCTIGRYYCSTNARVATLTNCPTTNAFVMHVSSPVSRDLAIPTTGYVYRLQRIFDYKGFEYIRYVEIIDNVPTYHTWRRILRTDNVDTALSTTSTNIVQNNVITNAINNVGKVVYSYWGSPTSATTATTTTGTQILSGTANITAGKYLIIGSFMVKTSKYTSVVRCYINNKEQAFAGTNLTDYHNLVIMKVVTLSDMTNATVKVMLTTQDSTVTATMAGYHSRSLCIIKLN